MTFQMQFLTAGATPERVFGLDTQTFISIGIQLLNATVLAVFLSILLYKPVRNYLRSRAERIKAQFDDAGAEMAKANDLKSQYENKLKDIESEREEILDSARKIAAEKSRLMLTESKNEAAALREKAAIDVENEKSRIKDEIKQVVIEVAAAMTEKFLVSAMDKATQDRLFNETLAELEEMTWQN